MPLARRGGQDGGRRRPIPGDGACTLLIRALRGRRACSLTSWRPLIAARGGSDSHQCAAARDGGGERRPWGEAVLKQPAACPCLGSGTSWCPTTRSRAAPSPTVCWSTRCAAALSQPARQVPRHEEQQARRALAVGRLFDADNHPSITFGVEGVRPSGESVHVSGKLTAGGRTRPLSFDAKVSVLDGGEVAVAAEVVVNRADFGMTWNQMGIASMNNTITIHAVSTRK
jgi:hypothetical protein